MMVAPMLSKEDGLSLFIEGKTQRANLNFHKHPSALATVKPKKGLWTEIIINLG